MLPGNMLLLWIVISRDHPEEIPNLFYAKAKEGYDIVFARRTDRKDTGLEEIYFQVFLPYI